MCLRVAFVVAFVAALAACSPHHLAGEATLASLDDEELCGRRSNLLNGRLMESELSRRGVDCGPYDEAGLRRGFHLWFLSPTPARVVPPPIAAAERRAALPAPPEEAPGDANDAGSGGMPVPEPASLPAPVPARERPAAPLAAAAPRVPPAAAPLIAPGCAVRSVQAGEEAPPAAAPGLARWSVTFRNTCRFPIRVLYAAAPSSGLAAATGLLQPGETSPPAPIESGFRQPGYVVCGYETTPEAAPCRLSGRTP